MFDSECNICYNNKISDLYFDCGHTCCISCMNTYLEKCSFCFICKKYINKKIKIYNLNKDEEDLKNKNKDKGIYNKMLKYNNINTNI